MIVEGSKIAYAGDDPFQDVGSLGRVVSAAGSGAHVMWETGPRAGMIELVPTDDLVPHRASRTGHTLAPTGSLRESFDAALDMPATPGLQVRATYDEDGEDGLLSALEEAGRIAVLAEYADEALAHVAGRIRRDPTFREVLSALEPDESDLLVRRVASIVLTDAISEEA